MAFIMASLTLSIPIGFWLPAIIIALTSLCGGGGGR
jgi:hypothetical protein